MADATNVTNTRGQYKHTNRLINETSPYLLQHAHNPVDWYAWGEEALQKGADRVIDKPFVPDDISTAVEEVLAARR